MKQKLTAILCTLGIVLGVGVLAAPSVGAVDLWKGCDGNSDSAVCASKGKDNVNDTVKNLINLSMTVIGIVAVIVIIISGFKFITANGDASKVASARHTLLYAVIGLIVALMSWAIVAFVVNRL